MIVAQKYRYDCTSTRNRVTIDIAHLPYCTTTLKGEYFSDCYYKAISRQVSRDYPQGRHLFTHGTKLQPVPYQIHRVLKRHSQCIHSHISYTTSTLFVASHLSTSTILPSCPPPLLPLITIKRLLPQLHIHIVMRLAHPPPKLIPTPHPYLLPLHILLKVLAAPCTWV